MMTFDTLLTQKILAKIWGKPVNIVEQNNVRVVLFSRNVFVKFYYDKFRSHEISVTFSSINENEESQIPFSLDEILRYFNEFENANWVKSLAISNENELPSIIDKLLSIVNHVINEISEGFFQKMALFREREGAEYKLDRDLTMARTIATSAWTRKDFPLVVSTLQPFFEYLKPSEKKIFLYSQSKISRSKP